MRHAYSMKEAIPDLAGISWKESEWNWESSQERAALIGEGEGFTPAHQTGFPMCSAIWSKARLSEWPRYSMDGAIPRSFARC